MADGVAVKFNFGAGSDRLRYRGANPHISQHTSRLKWLKFLAAGSSRGVNRGVVSKAGERDHSSLAEGAARGSARAL